MTGRPPASDLADLVAAVPGVSALYRPRTLPAALSAVSTLVSTDRAARVSVSDASVTVRVGIDGTRTIAAVARDIHRALSQHLAGGEFAETPIHLEIATVR